MTMGSRLVILLVSMATVSVLAGTAAASTPFKRAFSEKYVKTSDSAEFKKAYRKAGCYACHIKGKKKDWLNLYGHQLAKLISGNVKQRQDEAKKKGSDERKAEDEKIAKELEIAFEKVGKMKSPSGIPYDELFKAHKLPMPDGAISLKEEAENVQERVEKGQ